MGADRARIFIHFFSQVATLALIGVGIGLVVGASTALLVLPAVGEAVGVSLPPALHIQPLLVAAGVGLLTAFAFSYLPLLQAQAISPVTLFRSKGLGIPADRLARRALVWQIVPLLVAAMPSSALAILMTGDPCW